MYWQKLKLLLTDKLPVNKYLVVDLLLRNLLLRVFLHWICKKSPLFFFSDRNVFGVPLSVVLQRTGQPLPQSILFAINYLQRSGKITIAIAAVYVSVFYWYKLAKTAHISFRVCWLTVPQLHAINNYEYACYHIVSALDTWMS